MKYTISADADFVRTLRDPNSPTIRVLHAFVPVDRLPTNLPLDPDPRRPKETGEVPKRILSSLKTNDGRFHLLNRGITISCESCVFDNQRNELVLTIPSGDGRYGIIDGGHTYNSILKAKLTRDGKDTTGSSSSKSDLQDENLSAQYAHLEILEHVEEHLADIAEARNFSVQLKATTLAHYKHKFDWLVEALGKERAGKIIRLSENDEQPVNILDVVQVLGAINPTLFPDERPAQDAYKTAGKLLAYMIDDEDPYEFKKLANVALDVLKLYDYVRFHFQEKYNAPDDSGRRGKFAARRETKESQPKRGAKLKATYYWEDPDNPKSGELVIDKGLAIPLISGFRVLLQKDSGGMYSWTTNPFTLFDTYGDRLVRAIMNAAEESGNPWAVGRDPQVYRQLTSEVRRWYLEGKLASN
ncbi:MAG: AIPR protein [Acidobacteria bacterium OLB17]|nr:MAG: AIPR protein [Acidobacteria bacterium OLB17]MCZ2389771.1 AIPR family protein [Acidobacteriota bacterium]